MKTRADYIMVIEGGLSQALCNAIISEFENDAWLDAPVWRNGALTRDDNSRKVETLFMSREDVIAKNQGIRTELDAVVFSAVSSAVSKYNQEHGPVEVSKDSGYELLRYNMGGLFAEHTDVYDGAPRVISCSISLNDDFEGGEWSFFGGEVKFKPKKGSIVVFPSNFMFPHEIKTVTAGVRRSIVTWLS